MTLSDSDIEQLKITLDTAGRWLDGDRKGDFDKVLAPTHLRVLASYIEHHTSTSEAISSGHEKRKA